MTFRTTWTIPSMKVSESMTPKERQVMGELTSASQAVVANWERGDLAHAAHLCDAAAEEGRALLQREGQVMTVTACCHGDPSVGIPGDEMSLQLGRYQLADDDGTTRQYIRQKLAELAQEVFDLGPVFVYFEDECPDCGTAMKEGRCVNGDCGASRGGEDV